MQARRSRVRPRGCSGHQFTKEKDTSLEGEEYEWDFKAALFLNGDSFCWPSPNFYLLHGAESGPQLQAVMAPTHPTFW